MGLREKQIKNKAKHRSRGTFYVTETAYRVTGSSGSVTGFVKESTTAK